VIRPSGRGCTRIERRADRQRPIPNRETEPQFYLDLFGNIGNSLSTKSRGVGTILNDD
jgi:hypothetical protein